MPAVAARSVPGSPKAGQTVTRPRPRAGAHSSFGAGAARPRRSSVGASRAPGRRRARSELSRFGPQAGIAELVERWPAAVGDAIARQAWPARIARDGTLHANTTASVWRSSWASGPPRSPAGWVFRRCVSRPAAPRARRGHAACAGSEPAPEDVERPRSGSLDRRRRAPRKCAKSGQFAARQRAVRPPRLIHFPASRKTTVLQGFLLMAKTTAKVGYSAKESPCSRPRGGRQRPGMYIGSTGSAGCITSSTRSSTTQSTRHWPATAPRSRSPFSRTTLSRYSTTAGHPGRHHPRAGAAGP